MPGRAHKPHVSADPNKLPAGWQFDAWYKDEVVYPRIRGLAREGFSAGEIAERIGCSEKTVDRVIYERPGKPR